MNTQCREVITNKIPKNRSVAIIDRDIFPFVRTLSAAKRRGFTFPTTESCKQRQEEKYNRRQVDRTRTLP